MSEEKGYEVTEVRYERVFRLDQYESQRIGITAIPLPGQKTGDVVRALDAEITAIRNGTDIDA
jgi:hypothetical protein